MNDDFLNEMEQQGVKPLKQDKVAVKPSKNNLSKETLVLRRESAQSEKELEDPLASSFIKEVLPHDIIGLKKNGVQEGVYKKLRLGKYPSEARLDLHRHTVEEARIALYRFIEDCMELGLRSVIILHGKGDRDPVKKATIKSHVAHWLEEIDSVVAFHSAQPFHGGAGAVYVLFKKSDREKQKNRERFGGRS